MSERIRRVMAAVFAMDPGEITPDLSQKTLAKWDSMLQLYLVVALEREYAISFTPSEIGYMTDFAAVVKTLENKHVVP